MVQGSKSTSQQNRRVVYYSTFSQTTPKIRRNVLHIRCPWVTVSVSGWPGEAGLKPRGPSIGAAFAKASSGAGGDALTDNVSWKRDKHQSQRTKHLDSGDFGHFSYTLSFIKYFIPSLFLSPSFWIFCSAIHCCIVYLYLRCRPSH